MGAVISFFRPPASTQGNWSQQELAEFYRVEAALIRSGMRITSDQGLSDEADPWFVFCGSNGEAIIHFARIDGKYVVASDALDHPMQGPDFRALLNDIAARHPHLLPLHKADVGTKLVVHPAALLAAIVAAAALALSPDDAFADDLASDPTDRDIVSSPSSEGVSSPGLQPPKVKEHSDSRELGSNRRQVEGVLFSAMAFAAQAAAAEELDHRSAADLLEAGLAGGRIGKSAQGGNEPTPSTSGSGGLHNPTDQTLPSLGVMSGAVTHASSTLAGSGPASAPQRDWAELVSEATSPGKITGADSAPAGTTDSPVVLLEDATGANGTARSSSVQHVDRTSDALSSTDAARAAKQAATSADDASGRVFHQIPVQAPHQDNPSKATVGSDDGSGKESENEGTYGWNRVEQAAENVEGEDGGSGGSISFRGNGSNHGNGQGSEKSETAPGQLKKAEKVATAPDAPDVTSSTDRNEQRSGGPESAPSKVKHEDKIAAASDASDNASTNNGNGHSNSGSDPGPVKHNPQGLGSSDVTKNDASVSGNSNGHGSNKAATLDPSDSEVSNSQVETADMSGSASETASLTFSHAREAATGYQKPHSSAFESVNSSASIPAAQSTSEVGSPGGPHTSGKIGSPSSGPDMAATKFGSAPANIDQGGNLVFASDSHYQSKSHGFLPTALPGANEHTEVGLVGIASHNGSLHHPDYH